MKAWKVIVLSCSVLVLPSSASACEKWKSEIASLAWDLGGYIKAFTKYSNGSGDVMHHQLADKSGEVRGKILRIKSHVESTSSCDDPTGKYERRRNLLLNTMNTALPIIAGSKYLAPAIKDKLESEKE
jgi:hypothetical protein